MKLLRAKLTQWMPHRRHNQHHASVNVVGEDLDTTIPFLARVMADPHFQAGEIDTKFLEREAHLLKEPT